MENIEQSIDYDTFLDTRFELDVMMGNTTITVEEFLSLQPSNIILLDKMVGDGSDIYVNSRVVGNGEILVFDDHINIKVKDVSTADDAIGYFYSEGRE